MPSICNILVKVTICEKEKSPTRIFCPGSRVKIRVGQLVKNHNLCPYKVWMGVVNPNPDEPEPNRKNGGRWHVESGK
jgi:hypothetical protein